MSTTVVPFADEHVDGAVALLRRCHEQHLARQPLLSPSPDYDALIARERVDATGVVALRGGAVAGYLVGRHADGVFGRHVWSTSAGHAVEHPDLVADLYAAAAAGWVAAGLVRHFVFAPAVRANVEPWFRLGFGASAVQAARPVARPHPGETALAVRPSTPDDRVAIAALARELPLHLVASPSFSEIRVESLDELVEEWGDTWDRDDYVHFVADDAGRLVGQLLLFRRPADDLRVPPRSIDLANVTVAPDARGAGVATALFDAALTFAADDDLEVMITDWRATNVLAARVWPRRGFEPTYLRLARTIP